MEIDAEDLVRPRMFTVFFGLFIILGVASNFLMDDLGHGFSGYFLLYVALSLFLYYLGTRFVLRVPNRILVPIFVAVALAMSLREFGLYAVAMVAIILLISLKWEILMERCELVSLLGVALVLLNLLLLGVLPISEAGARFGSQTALMLFGYAFSIIGINFLFYKDPRKGLMLGAIVFIAMALYGFRSYLLIFASSICVQSIMLKRIRMGRIVGIAMIALVLIIFGGSFIVGQLEQEWHLSAFNMFFYRIGFTTHMLDLSCRAAGLFGVFHGEIWTLPSTSPLIGQYLVGGGNITTTILGPLVLDGGIFELPIMAFIGASLNSLYESSKRFTSHVPIYAIFFSILLISIEISPIPIFIFALLLALMISNAP